MAQRMMGQLDADVLIAPGWAVQAGRQALTALLALAFLGAALLLVVATDTRAVPSAPQSRVASDADVLRTALDDGLSVVSAAGVAAAGETTPAVDDAWRTLAVVHERLEARLRVAEGARQPLMGAPPPAPQRAPRDDALLRSALAYVGGALEARDVVALQRARDLLVLAQD